MMSYLKPSVPTNLSRNRLWIQQVYMCTRTVIDVYYWKQMPNNQADKGKIAL